MNRLRDSLRNGRVWKTTTLCKANNPAIQSTTTTATTNTTTTAMFALTQDPRIDSLQSNWILSIISTTEIDLQSAVWFVCCNSSELLEDEEVRFAVAFIDAGSSNGGIVVNRGGGGDDVGNNSNSNSRKLRIEDSDFCQALKLRKDQALLYSIRF